MAGFGDKLLAHLKTVPQATTEELAKVAEVTLDQAYNRLMALSYEKRTISAGKGKNRAWSLPGGAPVALAAPVKVAPTGVVKAYGWKPSLDRFQAVKETPKVGTKLLVEYPEDWRHTALVTVNRAPSEEGASLCWDLRNSMFTYVPVDSAVAAKLGIKLAIVTREKDLLSLQSAS